MLTDYKNQFANKNTYVHSSVENVVSDDIFNSKKAAKREKSRNQAVLPIFVGYAFDLLLFARRILAARLYISAENSFVTRCGTRQLSVAQLLLELCIQKVFCCLPKIIVSPISKSTSSFVDKTIEGIAFHLFYVFFHDAFGRRYNENDIRTICNSFVALS